MKQLILGLMAFLALTASAFTAHAANVSITVSPIAQGGTVTAEVVLSDAADVRGMELTISLPKGLTLNEVTSPKGLSVTHNTTSEGLKIVGFTTSSASVSNGTVLNLSLQAASDFIGGEIEITKAVVVNSAHSESSLSGSKTSVKVKATSWSLAFAAWSDLTKVENETSSKYNVSWEPSVVSADYIEPYTVTSSAPNIVSLEAGTATAEDTGTAEITVKSDNSDVKASYSATVVSTLTAISLNKTELIGIPGYSETLNVTYTPANTTSNKGITWSSSNDKVATVKSGVVTLVAPGTATITATSEADSKIAATCAVTVNAVLVTKLTLSDTDINVEQNKTVTLTATIEPDNATDKTVAWSSSNDKVATVEGGVVKGIAPGTATITATAGGKSASCTVTVTSTLTAISLSKTELIGIPGYSETLTVTYTPSNTTSIKGITWSSSNDKVARVESGVVTLVAPGTATITATSEANSDITATCDVTVNAVPVTKLTLSDTDVNVEQNKTVTLTAAIEPDNATDKTVTWSSSNASVATVEGGVVTAVAPGTATITATAGVVSATCKVTVTSTLTAISLSKSELIGIPGYSETLTVTYTPANTTSNKGITWSSSNSSVARVESGVVTLVAPGTATITATSEADSKIAATCDVTVNAVPVTKLTLSDTDINVEQNKTVTLTAAIEPDNATDKTVTWRSSNSSVATVEGGEVKGIAPGTATITATAGEKYATCKVTVVILTEGVSLDKNSLEFTFGDEPKQLKATIRPENTTDEVKWSSSNDDVARVESGVVTAVGPGTAIITVEAGGKNATCTVTVKAKLVIEPSTGSSDTPGETPVITPGESIQLVITVEPEGAEAPEVTWKSDDESIAKVDENGKVTPGDKSGTTTITATTPDGATITFKVTVNATDGITLDKQTLDLKATETYTLTATLDPSTSKDEVKWSSSNDEVARVESGVVTAVGPGTAVITVEAGGKKATCTVTVKAKLVIEPSTGSGDTPGETPVITPGESIQLVIKVEPEGAEAPEVTWKSDDESIAKVDENGKVTPGDKSGTTTITATTPDGATITFKVTVNATDGITLDKQTLDLKATETYTLTATLDPSTSKDEVKWSSSNDEVARVESGVVTAVGPGTAVITVEAGGKKATCTVTVKAKLVIEPSTGSGDTPGETPVITPGESIQLVIKVEPEGAEAPEVTWKSDDESIAKVDENGKVTPGDTSGTATITATTPDGETITFKVTVEIPTGIDGVNQDEMTGDVYNINGVPVMKGVTRDEVKGLTPGYYIFRTASGVEKILVR